MWWVNFRRLTKASVLAISIVVSTAAAAEAQSTDETATVNTTVTDGRAAIGREDGYSGTAGTGGSSGSGGGGGSGPRCTYAATSDGSWHETEMGGVVHRLFAETCDGSVRGDVWLPIYTPADVLVMARQQIERTLPEPSPLMVWPDPDYDWAYAQVPIDFRADASQWRVFQDTVTASNPLQTVSVTIRAEPAELTLHAGDPRGVESASCGGQAPLAPYVPEIPGICSYTYVNASSTARNGRSFVATMAMSWDITYWSTTDPGFSGSLPSVTRETVFPMEVAEVKILGKTIVP